MYVFFVNFNDAHEFVAIFYFLLIFNVLYSSKMTDSACIVNSTFAPHDIQLKELLWFFFCSEQEVFAS